MSINYFYGGNKGVLSCMRFLIRTICSTQEETDKNLMSIDDNDPCIEACAILHIILSRFSNHEDIWVDLTDPLKLFAQVTFNSKHASIKIPNAYIDKFTKKGKKKKPKKYQDVYNFVDRVEDGSMPKTENFSKTRDKIKGLKSNSYSIYGAIRAFIQTETSHFINNDSVKVIYDMFINENPKLQKRHPLVFSFVLIYMI